MPELIMVVEHTDLVGVIYEMQIGSIVETDAE